MERQDRFTALPELKNALAKEERSISWLARKAKVSQQLMNFVVRNERTIGEKQARLAAAALGRDLEDLFLLVSTSRDDLARDDERTAA